jgi:holo-[acyl-carrier protein] synthase
VILGIGIDLVELSRMEAALGRRGDRLIRRICTPSEVEQVQRAREPVRKLAEVFGVKEGVMKALGTGMRGVGWQEIDTSGSPRGGVEGLLDKRALKVARRLGATRYSYSVTLSSDIVLTAVLLSREEGP